MTKARAAEWLLSQVLPPDRAASTVGDWMEDIGQRGSIWFWSCVLRTVIAHVWSDVAGSPSTMAGLALPGYTRYSLGVVGMAVLTDALRMSHYRHAIYRWPFELGLHLTWFSWAFQTGLWLARRAPGRELSACAALSLIGWAALLGQELTSFQQGVPASYINLMGVAHDVALFAGAIWIRRRFLRAATSWKPH